MEIQERIKLIMSTEALSPSAFADKIGVQRSNISHVLSGRNKPGIDFLEKVLINFPRVDAKWLVTGHQSNKEQVTSNVNKVEASIVEIETLKDPDTSKSVETKPEKNEKKLTKLIYLYDDCTFDEYLKNE